MFFRCFCVSLGKKTTFMPLDFHPLSLSDRELVWRYTENAGRRNCDLSFANLYAWWTLYHTEIAEWGGFLLFRFQTDGHLAYLMPVGTGDWRAVLRQLKEDACRLSHPLLVIGVCEEQLSLVRDCMEGHCWQSENREHADYLYLRESLAALSGKRLQPKRNHVNRFMRLYPDCRYEDLTDEHVPACMELAERWALNHAGKAEQRAVAAETEAIRRALSRRSELGITGGVLRMGGRVVAFTYGAPICNDTFDVCVEKADMAYEGAYAVINKEFASRLPERFVYVNREEDLGVEGLRKAKLSYQPVRLLKKYSVWSSCTVEKERGDSGLTQEELQEKWQTRALWKLCFGDTEDFVRLYFSMKYTPQRNSCLKHDGRVTAALQRLPYVMMCGEAGNMTAPVAYVSGVCTHPEYRGKGYMTELMRQALHKMHSDGFWFTALIPADEGLFSFYEHFGYAALPAAAPVHFMAVSDSPAVNIEVCTALRSDVVSGVHSLFERWWKGIPWAFLHDEDDMRAVCSDLFLSGGCMAVARDGKGECAGALLAVRRGDELCILESCSPSQAVEGEMLRRACQTLGVGPAARHVRQCNRAQLRPVCLPEVMRWCAAQHPEKTECIQVVGDDVLTDNNGYYIWERGVCWKVVAPLDGMPCRVVHITEIPDRVLGCSGLYLSLMMN